MDYPQNREKYIKEYPNYFHLLQLTPSLIQAIEHLYPYPSSWKDQDVSEAVKKSWILLELTKTRESCKQIVSLLETHDNIELAGYINECNTSPGHSNYDDAIKVNVIPVKLPNAKYSQNYPMSKNPRGKAIIINVVPAEVKLEAYRFEHIFKEFKFEVRMHFCLSTIQIIDELKSIKKEIEDDEALMVMVITHGSDNKIVGNNYLNGSDAKDVIDIKQIVNIFPDVNNTVKLFFFTCCRKISTTKLSRSISLRRSFKGFTKNIFSASTPDSNANTNTFIYYSCAEGSLTPIENTGMYTPYGRALSECFAQYAYVDDMASIMNRTYRVMKGRYGYLQTKDVGSISPENNQRGTTHKLFFNPGWVTSSWDGQLASSWNQQVKLKNSRLIH